MENYEEKYKQALEKCKKEFNFSNLAYSHEEIKQKLEHIFPELKKSEDELIREEILNCFIEMKKQGCFPSKHEGQYDSWISWLEKQNKSQVRTGNEWVNLIDNACNHRYAEEYAHGEYCHEQSFKWGFQEGVDWLEKHPIFNMPKIEFKVGDWVIFKCGTPESVYKVEKLENYEYTLEHFLGGSMPLPFGSQSLLRPWTIKDANDGDVLATKKGNPFIYDKNRYNNGLAYYYAGIDANEELTLKSTYHMLSHFGELSSVFPATKEQRDFLFQKMKEAGYGWDTEKKELKKIKSESTRNV